MSVKFELKSKKNRFYLTKNVLASAVYILQKKITKMGILFFYYICFIIKNARA